MSYAPSGLLALRDALESVAPGAFLGIVGDKQHKSGYHLGEDRLPSNDYSNRTARDKAGLSDAAAAIDIGTSWPKSREWLAWLVSQCRQGAFADIREVIGSLDGKTAYRWDQEEDWEAEKRSPGDSHTWHTHISIYRDAVTHDLSGIISGVVSGGGGGASVPDWTEEILMNLPELRRGTSGNPVCRLQGLLSAAGNGVALDGEFGPRTEAAVRAVQNRNHLDVDGVVGRHTWSVLVLGADVF